MGQASVGYKEEAGAARPSHQVVGDVDSADVRPYKGRRSRVQHWNRRPTSVEKKDGLGGDLGLGRRQLGRPTRRF
jgi:hypothetical protein